MDTAKVVDFLVQAFATLLGAFAAFSLEAWRRSRDTRSANISAFKIALFTLVSYRTFLLNLAQQQLEPLREHRSRALLLRPIAITTPALKLDILSLSFLIDADQGNLLARLIDVEMKYQSVVNVIEQRNTAHLQLQERLAKIANPHDAMEAASNFVARDVVQQLEQLTDALYDQADRALSRNREIHDQASLCLKEMFGVKTFRVEEVQSAHKR